MATIRERPPLDLFYRVATPTGDVNRWGKDSPRPEDVPGGVTISSTMPGGWERFGATLPRLPSNAYHDLEPLSTITAMGMSGEVAGEFRIERTPRQSSDERTVTVEAVGWQAALEDDQTARMVYVDRDLGRWTEPSRARQINILTGGTQIRTGGPEVQGDSTTPGIMLNNPGVASAGSRMRYEAYYDAGPSVTIDSFYYDYVVGPSAAVAASHDLIVGTASDDILTATDVSADLYGASSGTAYYTPTADYRYAFIRWGTTADVGGENHRTVTIRNLAVYGNHGLTTRGATDPKGVYASDVLGHAVGLWSPLTFTTGVTGTIQSTAFVIPHLTFPEPTTAGEIVRQAASFHPDYDWAVWEDRTFYFAQRDSTGRRWRTQVRPSQLSETGPAIDRIWNGVIVNYEDVDGTPKTVGPTDSGADTETADLLDADTQNPATVAGVRRWANVSMGVVSTSAVAKQIGMRFLAEAKLLDQSGSASLVGYVQDDRGALRPAWQVRAGDQIAFIDAADTSYRRIIRADYSDDTKTCSVDLDAPPESLDALLERLGVRLVPLGVS